MLLKHPACIKKNTKRHYKKHQWRFIYVWREPSFINDGLNSNNNSKQNMKANQINNNIYKQNLKIKRKQPCLKFVSVKRVYFHHFLQ